MKKRFSEEQIIIWASASHQLRDQPDALEEIAQICTAITESIWDDIDSLIEEKFESDEKLKEIVNTLSDGENNGS